MSERRPITVGDIMSPNPVTLSPEDSLSGIEDDMAVMALHHLPVVDDGKLIGLVSQRDLLRAESSVLDPTSGAKNAMRRQGTFVYDVMTREVVTVRAETPLAEAARLLRDHRFGCLPVVDDAGRLVGIVTEHDFLELLVTILEREY